MQILLNDFPRVPDDFFSFSGVPPPKGQRFLSAVFIGSFDIVRFEFRKITEIFCYFRFQRKR